MNKYVKEFMHRGLLCMGFGPLVLAIVFAILSAFGVAESITVSQMVLGIFTITVIAFVAAGITVIYQIEKLPLLYAILIHCAILYVDYLIMYLVNGWLKDGITPLIVFTIVFILGFMLTWTIVYMFIRKDINKMNKKITKG